MGIEPRHAQRQRQPLRRRRPGGGGGGGRPLRHAALLLAPVALLGCREPGRLVDHEAWAQVPLAEDPWADHAPATVDCTPLAWGYEFEGGEDTLELDTQDCNYLTVRTQTLDPLWRGDVLKVRLWHFDLFSTDAAMAHALVQVGPLVGMDEQVPIPSDSEMMISEQVVDQRIPAGTDVYFHLHNHGANTWNLVAIDAEF